MKVILIVANGVNAGWFGTYGNEWISTPALDRFAVEAIVFDQHYADDPSPEGAAYALMRGRHACSVFTHDVPGLKELLASREVECFSIRDLRDDSLTITTPDFVEIGLSEDLPPEDLAGRLELALRELADVPDALLVIETDRLLPPWNVPSELFQQYAGVDDSRVDDADEGVSEEDFGTEDHTEDEEIEGIDLDETEPSLLEANPDGEAGEPDDERAAPLRPCEDPTAGQCEIDPVDWERWQASFAAVVTEFDQLVAALLAVVEEMGEAAESIVIITSGFGYPLGERGYVGINPPRLEESSLHLPLMIRLPGGEQSGRRVDALTQPIDLFPTLLEIFRISPPAGLHGTSLYPLLQGKAATTRRYAISSTEDGGKAIRTETWALFLDPQSDAEQEPTPRLYRKPEDRWEVNDVYQHHLEWAEYLVGFLKAIEANLARDVVAVLPAFQDYAVFMASASSAELTSEEDANAKTR